MDYVKQMEILRQRNIELVQENKELKDEIEKIKADAIAKEEKEAKSKEVFENTKQALINALEKYKSITAELENIKIDYQVKLRELSEMLLSTRDFVDAYNDDRILQKHKMTEAMVGEIENENE